MFVDIPLRQNGQKIVASWYNLLRAAGILVEGWLGASFLQETLFAIVNNTASPTDVTGLVFDSTVVHGAIIEVDIYRYTTGGGGMDRKEYRKLYAFYKVGAGAWDIVDLGAGGPDDSGVVLTITGVGQVQYTSDNQTGTANTSRMLFKAHTFGL